jgi:hypothetical protein
MSQKHQADRRVDEWIKLSEATFEFACYARCHFQHRDNKTKRLILQTIGANYLLKDKKLLLDVPKPFKVIENMKIEVDKTLEMLEPVEKFVLTQK